MSPRYTDITGYILAGGDSRRFGRDKRRVLVGGVTLLEKTTVLLTHLIGREPFIVGDNVSEMALAPSRVIHDVRPGCGPLGGLVAALHHSPTSWSLLMAVDMPLLTIADLRRLVDARSDTFDVVALSKTGAPEPLAALYHRRRSRYWRSRLDSRLYSLAEGIDALPWKPVILGASTTSLENLNTPEDLDEMETYPQ